MRSLILAVCMLLSVSSRSIAEQPAGKTIPWERIEGINASDFKSDFLARVAAILEKVPSYGRCTESVAACLRKKQHYATAGRLARDILMLVISQAEEEKIVKWVDARRRMAHPEKLHSINIEGLTPLGNKAAKVTIVEFSDFQCPYCAKIWPMLEEIARERKDKVRLFFKQFPIKGHPRALAASKACVAADKFGKFWDYCGKLFESQRDLSDKKFIELAEQCGIDKTKFTEEMNQTAVLNRIADEKMEGLRIRIQGTPTIFINGKEVILEPTVSMIKDRIQEELDILAGKD
ncbi:MAG: thioredoxin domain-containing protein [Deltaproteobacteria bacterium]|nr:thioredoxin domain-containing protein [Deltaproteobacteria bacterium]